MLAILVGATLVWIDRRRKEMLREEVYSIVSSIQEVQIPRESDGFRSLRPRYGFELPERERERLRSQLPDSVDALFDILTDKLKEPTQDDWEVIAPAQFVLMEFLEEIPKERIDSLYRAIGTVTVNARPQYPQGFDSYIGTAYAFEGGLGSTVETVSRRTLDGHPYGETFHYEGATAGTGGINIKDLAIGSHTVRATTDYTVSHEGVVVATGILDSGRVPFEIVSAETPDPLAAPQDPKRDQRVRAALEITEIRIAKSVDVQFYGRYLWPNSGSTAPDGKEAAAIRLPVWELTAPLPVDLLFDVEFHVEDTGEIYEADPLVQLKGRKRRGFFSLRDTHSFWTDRVGSVPLRIVLKPSRARALSNLGVTQYYNGPVITSQVMNAEIFRYNESDASPGLLRARHLFSELMGTEKRTGWRSVKERMLARGIDQRMYYALNSMTSLNPYRRESGIWGRYSSPEGDVTPALPILIELLGDTEYPSAGKAGAALANIGEVAIVPLVNALKHEDAGVRRGAAYALGSMANERTRDTMAPLVVDPLKTLLNDEDTTIREAVLRALQRFPD